MKTHRLARVAEAVREVASQTILFELQDPRIKQVTVTRAEVSGDLQHAKVFVSIMGTPSEQRLCLHALKHATGFVQARIANRLQIRYTPALQFVLDQGVKHSIEMTRLINEALATTRPASGDDQQSLSEKDSADGSADDHLNRNDVPSASPEPPRTSTPE